MEKIERYIATFFKGKRMNKNYSMRMADWTELASSRQGSFDVVLTTFNFGYAKGYRAAMSEMRKGGMK